MPTHSLLFSKSTKGAVRLNVPIRRTNRYQQYYMLSEHTYCGRVWNLIQACDVQSSPEVENFQMKIYYPTGDRTPDLLNHRQTCYHVSQRGEQVLIRQIMNFIFSKHIKKDINMSNSAFHLRYGKLCLAYDHLCSAGMQELCP